MHKTCIKHTLSFIISIMNFRNWKFTKKHNQLLILWEKEVLENNNPLVQNLREDLGYESYMVLHQTEQVDLLKTINLSKREMHDIILFWDIYKEKILTAKIIRALSFYDDDLFRNRPSFMVLDDNGNPTNLYSWSRKAKATYELMTTVSKKHSSSVAKWIAKQTGPYVSWLTDPKNRPAIHQKATETKKTNSLSRAISVAPTIAEAIKNGSTTYQKIADYLTSKNRQTSRDSNYEWKTVERVFIRLFDQENTDTVKKWLENNVYKIIEENHKNRTRRK